MLDLRLLHQVIVLASFRNYARAAAALHLTQPALSRSIAGLEARLGERLFNRSSQGVEPTAFGELLRDQGQALLDSAAKLESQFTRMRSATTVTLRVGVGAYPAQLSVGEAVGRLNQCQPGLAVEVISNELRDIAAGLLDGRLDLAVMELSTVLDEPRFTTEPLPQHAAAFYCRIGHPLQNVQDPRLDQVLAYPYVGTRMPARMAAVFFGAAQSGSIDAGTGDYLPPIKVDSVWMARDIVRASDAVAIAPLSMIADDVSAGRLYVLPLRTDWTHTGYGFVRLRELAPSLAMLAFMATLRGVEADIAARMPRYGTPIDK
jgi:DNA-binding transcriptional LysR family regulator